MAREVPAKVIVSVVIAIDVVTAAALITTHEKPIGKATLVFAGIVRVCPDVV